jgi:hypothetical protein
VHAGQVLLVLALLLDLGRLLLRAAQQRRADIRPFEQNSDGGAEGTGTDYRRA